MHWLWPVLATLLASVAALIGSSLVLWLRRMRPEVIELLLAWAVGTLLAAAFLDLLPEAAEHAEPEAALSRTLLGILGFFALERLLRWRHPHADDPASIPRHPGPPGAQPVGSPALAALILWSDGFHNLVDGFVIGGAFASGADLGVTATLAVIAHEIPQEVGDFAVLLAAGLPWRRALLLNLLVQLPPVPVAAGTFLLADVEPDAPGWLLPLAAGGLIYIALADLVPSLHHRAGRRAAFAQLFWVAAGIATLAALTH